MTNPNLPSDILTRVSTSAFPRLYKQWQRIQSRQKKQQPVNKDVLRFQHAVEKSARWVERRRQSWPDIVYPQGLPIAEKAEQIRALINQHQVVVVAGETGSGKTTQLPKICLQLGMGARGLIGHTQPRRVAARTVAQRIAKELGTELGNDVGYQVRFHDQSSDETLVKLMTDGILLAEIQRDPLLSRYECIIIDEAHERSLNIDFLLGYFKRLLPKRPDLKIVITSATIDLERFSKHFNDAPVIEVSGRTFPVHIEYAPIGDVYEDQTQAIVDQIGHIQELERSGSRDAQDILIFLSGEREIRDTALAIRRAKYNNLDVLPLYSRLTVADQDKIFKPSGRQRVVLATNVAETSLTVPGIGYVIDPGKARISRYSVRNKVQRLPIEPVSQASANQRAGRCGRIAEGVCIRLYSEQDYLSRPEFTPPEILRTNLATVILQMQLLGLGDIEAFPFVEPPDKRQINDGVRLLFELGILDGQRTITKIGRDIAPLPLDPRLSRMLYESHHKGCLREMLIVVSGLSVADPRDRPADKQQQADQAHRTFVADHSDFDTLVSIWDSFEKQRQELSNSQLRKWCEKHYLSHQRMREWRDIHHQLRIFCKERKWSENKQPNDYRSFHQSILSGLITQIGMLQSEDKSFLSTRSRKFHVFPASSQFKKPPKWIMSAELIETSRLFAHMVAKIDPSWVLPLADHLMQRQYNELHYSARRGEVMAKLRLSLYGLVLDDSQRVSYKGVDPQAARELFIREALANWRMKTNAPFFRHNKSLWVKQSELEARTRRADIQLDEHQLYAFYDEILPPDVLDDQSFHQWRKSAEKKHKRILYLDNTIAEQRLHTVAQFPDYLEWDGVKYVLQYHFEPGHPRDGVTMRVPIEQLHQVPESLAEWLVPGLLEEKVTALLKSLPKQWRRHFVPIPQYAARVARELVSANTPLTAAISLQCQRLSNVEIPEEVWQSEKLEPYYRMNFSVEDASGKSLHLSKDLSELHQQYRQKANQLLAEADHSQHEVVNLQDWSIGDLQESVEVVQSGHRLRLWPALEQQPDNKVNVTLFDHPIDADIAHAHGQIRLFLIAAPQPVKYLRKELFKTTALKLMSIQLASVDELKEQLILAAARQCFVPDNRLIRDEDEFSTRLQNGQNGLVAQAFEIEKIFLNIADAVRELKAELSLQPSSYKDVVADIQQQVSQLLHTDLMFQSSILWLKRVPLLIKAASVRLDKLSGGFSRDRDNQLMINHYERIYHDMCTSIRDGYQWHIPALVEFRWIIEEMRVSVFAQPMKTLKPVSEKRMQARIDEIQATIQRLQRL